MSSLKAPMSRWLEAERSEADDKSSSSSRRSRVLSPVILAFSLSFSVSC